MPLLTPPAEAETIVRRLRDKGHTAYFCGGCVRDALLGNAPKDYDITTSAVPDAVEALFPKTIPIGKAFGVMLVEGEDGGHYEVATFRRESGYADGRRPDDVTFSDAREDARRRDFTMNALF
jgi:poly(A) polymerase